jgi:hypothetical protein
MNAYRGLGVAPRDAAAASVRPLVWCLDCGRRSEPDPAEMAERFGADTTVPDGRARLVCGGFGSRNVDMVVGGAER